MHQLPHSPSFPRVPTVRPEAVRQITLAGRELTVFRLYARISSVYAPSSDDSLGYFSGMTVFHEFFFRSADVLVDDVSDSPTHVDARAFFAALHQHQSNIPDFVWLDDRAVTPIPLLEAITFWSEQAARANVWARLVARDVSRIEELARSAFGMEVNRPDSDDWEINYRGDGGLMHRIGSGPTELGPPMYRPIPAL